MASVDSFGAKGTLDVQGRTYEIFRLNAVTGDGLDVDSLPFSLKVLLENLLRTEDGANVTAEDIRALAGWDADAEPSQEIQFAPARVLMQDFTGVPCVVDLATMREAMVDLGGDATMINPLAPAELVIDHSVVADVFGSPEAFERNVEIEYERNRERYQFLRWGQGAFADFKVVPPGTGIVHQVNIEHLARTVFTREPDGVGGVVQAYPDTCVGTDSHTTMVNGIGVVGWGVGGIEAEAAMLGQPVSMLIPRVVGFKLSGELPDGSTATDLVLTITQMLRKHGVVGKFVEFYGPAAVAMPTTARASISNMSPEFGSTIAVFPIDEETIRYLRLTGRSEENLALVEAYAKEQGLWHDPSAEPRYSEKIELDLATVVPSLAGPKRPHDLVLLADAKSAFRVALSDSAPPTDGVRPTDPVKVKLGDGTTVTLDHGAVVIAAITSCTNTSNPSVMIAAALVAKKAVERGLQRKPWVKTTLAPGSKVVSDYYDAAGLTPYLDKLGFNLVGYGCTTCIGNSGPLIPEVSAAVNERDLSVVSVLSGNRNFEGRINAEVKMNYLASPPLVVAYALAGSMDVDLFNEPLGTGTDGEDVYLKDIWPSPAEVERVIGEAVSGDAFSSYAEVFGGDERWRSLSTPEGNIFDWDETSTYVRKAPYFEGMPDSPASVADISGARVLLKLGDSVTTDHISPAGSIKKESPAGQYLVDHGVEQRDFNSYGSRRGNHEVLIRGTFANIRLRNQIAPDTEGGFTRDFTKTDSPVTTVYDASMSYIEQRIPLIILAGEEYGSGSSRDWAAKGTALLGVKAVIAKSYERIHRSNLIGMGVLPLQFQEGHSAEFLGLTGEETFDIEGITVLNDGTIPRTVTVTGGDIRFDAVVRIDTPGEADYYRHGGILQYVLRSRLNPPA